MAGLLCYLIAADSLAAETKFAVWRTYDAARGTEFDTWLESGGTEGKVENLPEPVEGSVFTAEDAKAYAIEAGEFQAT